MSNLLSDTEQLELLAGFVEESNEMLDEVEPQLVELEKSSDQSGQVDPDVINTIFRLFHSLKGGAGFLGFTTVGKVTHTAETLLDLFRKQAATLNSDHIDILIITCDFLRQLFENIDIKHDDLGFENEADVIVSRLKLAIDAITLEPESQPRSVSPVLADSVSIDPAPAAPAGPEVEAPPTESEVPQLVITPEMTHQFTTEADELLETAEVALLSLEKENDHQEYLQQAFRALHSFKGNAGFFGFSDLQRLSHQTETVLDSIRGNKIVGDNDLFSLLLEIVDSLREGVSRISRGEDPKIIGITGWISLLNETIKQPSAAKAQAELSAEEAIVKAAEEIIDDPQQDEVAAQTDVDVSPATANTAPAQKVSVKITTDAAASVKPAALERRTVEDRRSQDRRTEDGQSGSKQTVRVDVEKLDSLLDLVGELVIAEAMVAQNPDLKGVDLSLDRFEKSVMQLDKITRDLQGIATAIRMIPLAGTFRHMIRLVRDLSQKAGKKVELQLIGEETEVDKTVIEQINDPLVHIIRNSIDHGIETPADRAALGKDPAASVTLEAKYVGGEVWIMITDDGRGLNREKILSKAIERGLISGDGSDLEEEAIWQLIFQPGFSTADKITDVSGRGVGMDVVKRNIENIRGRVDVRTSPSKGTTIILRIPLTLAIIDGMIVRVGDTRYTIPLVAIKESLRPRLQDVTHTMDGKEIVNIRGMLLPVLRLHELFNVRAEHTDLSEGIIIVVENQGETICLFVDEQLGQQQIVIKGLSDYFGAAQCVSGCTILGDGDISLIIDVAGIIAMAEPPKMPGASCLRNDNRNIYSENRLQATV
ncbi:MAG: chemotaxis protein CheA [bacterium]|nr:chemotaxis protein CheA [bacterium]